MGEVQKVCKLTKASNSKTKIFQNFLKSKKIHSFTTENPETKASIVERFQRTFYSQELQRVVKDQIYEIESVLAHRKRKVGKKWVKEIKVHWKGYPFKFDNWILEFDLVKKHENGFKKFIRARSHICTINNRQWRPTTEISFDVRLLLFTSLLSHH